jgi:hypothetical protein
MMPEFAPRIHVLLAREAPVGVVIRRGPSKQVCTMLWDRRDDELRMGQWLKGKIYERRSDLSPDGKHLIYFAMNGRWKEEAEGSWTAISRAPYLKAIAFFPKGDCWHGGGLFLDRRTYWLNWGFGHKMLRDNTAVRRDPSYQPDVDYGGECLGVYYPRLLRDGWSLTAEERLAEHKNRDTFEKPAPRGWTLRKIAHAGIFEPPGKGCYWDEHELVHERSGHRHAFPDWEWADLDGERLVWAAGGKLMAASLGYDGPVEPNELYDFNGMEFEPIAAPY